MAEVKNEEKKAVEVKEKSKTDRFKEHIQKIIYQELGVKVSKDKAWGLFKAIIHGTTEFVLNLDGDKKLPLSGVGTFQVLETKPRGSKAGLDDKGEKIEGAKVWPFVPRFRFYPSSVIDSLLEQFFDLEDHGIEMKHYGIFRTEEEVAEPKKDEKAAKKQEKKAEKSKKEEAAPVEDNEATEVDVDNFDDEI